MQRSLFHILRNLVLLILLLFPFLLFATHQRAAEITFRHVSALTYEISLISYTYTPSPANAYRDFLTIEWGDGTSDLIPRVQKIYLPNDITYNLYIGQHIYAGPSTYTISCEDPNRNGGIINIPNSINTPMFIYSELTISPFMQYDNSPILLVPPIDNACVGQPFYHNPGAYDPDGDSLSYKLVPCRGAGGLVIPGYFLPPPPGSCKLDSVTGDFTWKSPEQQGEFNIAILIEEWRNGVKIGSVLRDMQIIVVACQNRPPVVDSVSDTCVEAGHTLRFPVSASDPDSLDVVTLTATGGPFILAQSPAYMVPDSATGTGHVTSVFHWPTVCSHVRKSPYQVLFKAQDNGSPVELVDIRSMKILVVGPGPVILSASPMGNSITLTWKTYECQNASGFYIYRKPDSSGFVPAYCQTGVPAYLGYTKIGQLNDITTTSFLDDNNGAGLNRGIKYCYLITAFFHDGAESYASNEVCAELKKDVPVITNVSINTTSTATGSLYLAWSKPTQLDTVQAPGPYKYIVNRARSDNPGQFSIIDSLFNLNDTIKTDTLLNTAEFGYRYKIDLYNLTPGNYFFIGSSQPASSMFLSLYPTDKKMRLYWTNDVPWNNAVFPIYRSNSFDGIYDSVGYSFSPNYVDKGLSNGTQYFYRIKSTGRYSATGFIDPIINFSQKTGGVPVDNVPPCAQLLSVTTLCDQSANLLHWRNPSDTCGKDIAKYYIYYSNSPTVKPSLIDSVISPLDTSYLHLLSHSIVGCYSIIAVDSVGNRSDFSNTVCIDYTACPDYRYWLPNVFTPNGDGVNDLFKPKPYTSIASISLQIFSRWGRLVFETSDPDVNWDGRDSGTKEPCAEGTYFYICDVYEITLSGIQKRTLHGSVTILR
jgi:gliding motility-associated-like protein